MSKGKYAARAANREVARDNELLVEKAAEITALKEQLAEQGRQLYELQRDANSLIVTRAAELSAAQIAAIRQGAQETQQRREEQIAQAVQLLIEHFKSGGADEWRIPNRWTTHILPLLVPGEVGQSQTMCDFLESEGEPFNRAARRHGVANVKRSLNRAFRSHDIKETINYLKEHPERVEIVGHKFRLKESSREQEAQEEPSSDS